MRAKRKGCYSTIVQRDDTAPRLPEDVTLAPFINQITVVPSVNCHKMSVFPSPLKSPVALICQPVGPAPSPEEEATWPWTVLLMNQIDAVPSVSRHRIS